MAQAISYIRFSSIKQEQGSSLQRQQDMVNKWLLDNPAVKISYLNYQDLGKSGYKGDHLKNAFGDMLDAIEKGKIRSGDYILAEAIDRIGRLPTVEMINIITSICLAGVKIITLEDNQEYSEESISANAGIIYFLIGKIDMAHQYSKRLSERLEAAWNLKVLEAQKGNVIKRKTVWWLTKDSITEVYNVLTDTDKSLMTSMFTWYLNGLSQEQIIQRMREYDQKRVDKLNIGKSETDKGFELNKFIKTTPTALKKMLQNRTAISHWNSKHGEIKNIYPAAITDTLFYEVQKEIKRRASGRKQGKKSNHIMAGLVVCSNCNSNYSIRNHKHSSTVMYCSTANKDNTKCSNTTAIPVAVINEFRLRTQQPFIQEILNSEMQSDSSNRLVVIDGELGSIKSELEMWSDLVGTGSRTALSKITELETKEDALNLERIGITNSTTNELAFGSLFHEGLSLTEDPLVMSSMLAKVGYKINGNNRILTVGNNSIEYISYSNTNGYKVIEEGEETYYKKPKDASLAEPELLYQQLNSLTSSEAKRKIGKMKDLT